MMFFRSLKHAVRGFITTFRSERNFRIMIFCFAAVILLGLLFGLSALEWAAILLCCCGVIALEMINTAIEAAVDLKTTEQLPLAGKAKDVAAGAVLVFSGIAAIVGAIIFLPKIVAWIFSFVVGGAL